MDTLDTLNTTVQLVAALTETDCIQVDELAPINAKPRSCRQRDSAPNCLSLTLTTVCPPNIHNLCAKFCYKSPNMLVSLTVGKVDAGVAVLLTEDKRLVRCPLVRFQVS